ncbi:hypothetical protein [Zoogloea sp.]|uniref:hypothetical protein n=1 Tax=Zoogloea sp. TaxID=49181 RepID=UPI0035AEBBAC
MNAVLTVEFVKRCFGGRGGILMADDFDRQGRAHCLADGMRRGGRSIGPGVEKIAEASELMGTNPDEARAFTLAGFE